MKNSKENLIKSLTHELGKLVLKIESLLNKSKTLSYIRFEVFAIGIILFFGLYLFGLKSAALISAVPSIVVFSIFVVIHNRVENSITKFKTYLQIKKEELARLELDWENIPKLDNVFSENSTPLETDLNITGKNSLLQLLNTAISFEGINILRNWLSGKFIGKEEIENKQKIVYELKNLKRFRYRLLLTSRMSVKEKFAKVEISDWLKKGKRKKGLRTFTFFVSFLCLLNMAAIFAALTGITEKFYYQFLLVYILIYFSGFKFVNDIKKVSEFLFDEIRKFASIFSFIEESNFNSSPRVKEFLNPIINSEISPSKSINKINFTVEILNLRGNPFVWFMITALVPIDFLIALRIEKFRESIKNNFPKWLETLETLEAYNSLAAFACVNPDFTFPKLNVSKALFEAEEIGHPIIRYDQKVRNNFSLSENNRTNIITGSNMSGKSTFLRTVGINLLLAYAGSVVDAKKMILGEFNLFSCIKVSDSVVDGISYFYAEVKRLKMIMDEIEKTKTNSLVLIDEIYKGTNNIERLLGSRAFVKELSAKNVFSVISTHDLELVTIVDEIKNGANYHFKELIENRVMSFDYKLNNGPCPTTNALKIMELEGLPIK